MVPPAAVEVLSALASDTGRQPGGSEELVQAIEKGWLSHGLTVARRM